MGQGKALWVWSNGSCSHRAHGATRTRTWSGQCHRQQTQVTEQWWLEARSDGEEERGLRPACSQGSPFQWEQGCLCYRQAWGAWALVARGHWGECGQDHAMAWAVCAWRGSVPRAAHAPCAAHSLTSSLHCLPLSVPHSSSQARVTQTQGLGAGVSGTRCQVWGSSQHHLAQCSWHQRGGPVPGALYHIRGTWSRGEEEWNHWCCAHTKSSSPREFCPCTHTTHTLHVPDVPAQVVPVHTRAHQQQPSAPRAQYRQKASSCPPSLCTLLQEHLLLVPGHPSLPGQHREAHLETGARKPVGRDCCRPAPITLPAWPPQSPPQSCSSPAFVP